MIWFVALLPVLCVGGSLFSIWLVRWVRDSRPNPEDEAFIEQLRTMPGKADEIPFPTEEKR